MSGFRMVGHFFKSLGRFIYKEQKIIYIKRSRLVDHSITRYKKCPVFKCFRFSNVRNSDRDCTLTISIPNIWNLNIWLFSHFFVQFSNGQGWYVEIQDQSLSSIFLLFFSLKIQDQSSARTKHTGLNHKIRWTIRIPDILDHKTDIFVQFSDHHSKPGPFDNLKHLDHLNTRLLRYSDGYCVQMFKKSSGCGKVQISNDVNGPSILVPRLLNNKSISSYISF